MKNPKDPNDRCIAFVKPSVSCGAKKLSRSGKIAGNVYIVWPYQRGNHLDPLTQDILKLMRIQNQTVVQKVREHGRVTFTNNFLVNIIKKVFQCEFLNTLTAFAVLIQNLISKTRQ